MEILPPCFFVRIHLPRSFHFQQGQQTLQIFRRERRAQTADAQDLPRLGVHMVRASFRKEHKVTEKARVFVPVFLRLQDPRSNSRGSSVQYDGLNDLLAIRSHFPEILHGNRAAHPVCRIYAVFREP